MDSRSLNSSFKIQPRRPLQPRFLHRKTSHGNLDGYMPYRSAVETDFADCMLTESRRRYEKNLENWSSLSREECQKQLAYRFMPIRSAVETDFADCMLTESRRRYEENPENWSSLSREECQKLPADALNTNRNQMLELKSRPPTTVDSIPRRSVHQSRPVKPPRPVPQLDERARLQLKDLLDAANRELLSRTQSKIIAAERSGVPRTCFSQSPHPNARRASSGATQASNPDFCSNSCTTCPCKLYAQSFIEGAPRDPASELSRLSISTQKSQNRKKRCSGCQRSNTKRQASASISNKDGIYREQHPLHALRKGSVETNRKGLRPVTGNEKPRYERSHEIQGKSSLVPPIACCAMPQHNEFVKSRQENSSRMRLIDSHLEETASNFSQQIPTSMRRTNSRISNSQLCCENPDHVKPSSAASGRNLSSKDNALIHVMQSKEGKGKPTTVSDGNSAKKQNFKAIVQRIDSLSSRASPAIQSGESMRSQRHECVYGSRIPRIQVGSFQDSPGNTLKISQQSEVSINQPKRKSRPSVLPRSGRSHRKNLPTRPCIRPTLLDYDDDNDSSQEYADDSSSENSGTYASSTWTSQEQSSIYDTKSPESYSEDASSSTRSSTSTHTSTLTRTSKRYKPRSREKKPIGGFRKLKDKLGFIFHHHHHHHHHHHYADSEDDSGSENGPRKSMWKHLKNMFHHKDEEKVIQGADCEKEAVRKLNKSVVRRNKEQIGHFHALVKGVMRNVKHSKKKPKPLKGGRATADKHWWQVFEKKKHGRGVKLGSRGKRVKLAFRSKKTQVKHLS